MSETNETEFDTGRSIAEKLQAEVLEENPQTFFVRYGEDDADIEPKTWLNTLIFNSTDNVRDKLYDFLVYGEPLSYTWMESDEESGTRSLGSFLRQTETRTQHKVEVTAEDGGAYFEIALDSDSTPVPSEKRQEVIKILADDVIDEEVAGQRLADIREEIEANYADRTVIQAFLGRYPDDRVRPTRNGWVVDDTFVVHYDGENYWLDDPGTWRASDTVHTNEDHEFLTVNFDIDAPIDATAPDGETYTLSENDMEFLAMVETLLYPEDNLGYDMAGRVVEARDVDEEPRETGDPISDTARTANDSNFKDDAGQVHGHTLEKHSLTSSFNVTNGVVDRLHYQQNGHAGVNELARREKEFKRADFDVFYDVPNDDRQRWAKIKRHAKKAPISPRTQRKLDSMFGSV